jgi:hypothetical protein
MVSIRASVMVPFPNLTNMIDRHSGSLSDLLWWSVRSSASVVMGLELRRS